MFLTFLEQFKKYEKWMVNFFKEVLEMSVGNGSIILKKKIISFKKKTFCNFMFTVYTPLYNARKDSLC